MALKDVSGYPLKWEAQIDLKRAEADAKRLKDLFGTITIDTKPAAKSLSEITKESSKTIVVSKELNKTFGELSGNMQGVHTAIAKAKAETQSLAQTERDLRKALKDNLITEEEYIKKLALISARRTEINDKLREYRTQLKAVEVEKSKAKPYSSADTAFEIQSSKSGQTGTITSGTVTNPADIERAAAANANYASSIAKTNVELKNQVVASTEVKKATDNQIISIEALKQELADYRIKAAQATDPEKLKLYNSEIQTLEKEIGKASNVGKAGFDNLGNAIDTNVKKANAFTNAVNKSWRVLRMAAYIIPGLGIAGLMSLLIDPIQKLIEKAGQLKKALASAFENTDYKQALKDVKNLQNSYSLYEKGVKTGKQVTDEFNKTLGDTAGKLRNISEVQDFLNNKAADYVKAVKMRAEAQALFNVSIDKTIEAQKRAFEGPTWTQKGLATAASFLSGGATYQDMLRQITQEELIGLTETSIKAEEAWKALTKKSEEFNKEHGFKFDNEDMSKYLKSADTLQQKISEIKAKYTRNLLSPDDSEIQAVKDEFKKIEDLVKKFNADPKNKIKVSLGDLEELMNNAITDLRYKQETELLKGEIEKQKTIFSEFEDFKEKTSHDSAIRRYGAEKAEFDTFEKYLEQEQAGLYDTAQTRDLTRGEVERLKYINTELESLRKENRKKETENFLTAYEAAKTHAQKLEDIDEDYYRKVAALRESATMEQLEVLDKDRKERISAEVAANLKIENNWEEMFANMSLMSKAAVNKYLEGVKKKVDAELKAGKITIAEYKNLTREINQASDTNKTSFERLVAAIKAYRKEMKGIASDEDSTSALLRLGSVIDEVARDINQVIGIVAQSVQKLDIGDENLDKTLSNIGGFIEGVGELSKGISDKNPIAIITGSIKLLTSAIDLFNNKDKKLQKQIDNYQKQLDSLGRSYKQLEKDISNSVGNSYYADSDAAIANMEAQIVAIEKMRKAEQDKKKTDNGKIADFDDQILGLKDSIAQTQQAISEMLLQTNFKQFSQTLTDALVSAFEAGEDGIDAMNDAFDQFIKNAIANAVKLNVIEKVVNEMMNAATAYAKENDNSLIGFDFEKYRNDLTTAVSLGKQMYEGALTDLGLEKEADKTNNQNSISKGIEGIKETTANRLEAEFGGLRLAQLQLLEITKEQVISIKQSENFAFRNLETALKIERNTFRTAENTEHLSRLGNIETAIVSLNNKITDIDSLARGAGLRNG